MPNDPEVTACFRVHGDKLDPDRVTALLKIPPSHAHRRGEVRAGSRSCGQWENGIWICDSPLERTQGVEAHLDWLLEHLVPKRELLEQLSRGGFDMDFLIGYFSGTTGQGGFDLAPHHIRDIASLGAGLCVDIYGSSQGGQINRVNI